MFFKLDLSFLNKKPNIKILIEWLLIVIFGMLIVKLPNMNFMAILCNESDCPKGKALSLKHI